MNTADADLALAELWQDLAAIDLGRMSDQDRDMIVSRFCRAAYGKGYAQALGTPTHTLEEAQRFTLEARLRLPVE